MIDQAQAPPRSPWVDYFFRPVLVVIMIMCLSFSLVNLVRLFNPAWRGAYFLVGMLLTAAEAIFSYRLLKRRQLRGLDVLRYRLAEAAVLVLLLKLLSFGEKRPARIWSELLLMWQDPLNFINIEFYVLLVLALVAWLAATDTIDDFEALYDPAQFYSEHVLPLSSLAGRFYWGGVMLVLVSGVTQWLSRAGLSSLIDFRRPSLGGVILNVLVYFILGLVLLSQAHLTRLQVRWSIQRITVTGDLARQWARYGLILLGLVGLVAFLLPTSYSLGFLETFGFFFQLLLGWLIFLLQLLFFLLLLPLAWLLSLFGQELALTPMAAPPATLQPGNSGGATRPAWLDILRSLLFWLVIATVAWYLVKNYFADHPELGRGLGRIKFLGAALALLARLWRRLAGLARLGWDRVLTTAIFRESGPSPVSRSRYRRWAGLGSLTAREKVVYYYLNILERVQKGGLARRPPQTPFEFEPELSQAAPEAEQEVSILTQAFVQARYSRQELNETQAGLARVLWQRIRQALNRR